MADPDVRRAAGVLLVVVERPGQSVGKPPGRAGFTSSRWGKGKLTMLLTQPEVIEADEATREAVEDLLDRVGMGDEFWKARGRRD